MKTLATRGGQYPLLAEFVFAFNDWVVDSVDGAKKTLGSTVALSVDPGEPGLVGPVANTIVFDAIPLPYGAVIIGGEVIVETPFVGPTAATLSLGVAGNAAIYLAAQSLLAAGRFPLLLTSVLGSNAGQNARMTLAYTVANATAGKARVRVGYTIDGRAAEMIGQ